MSCDLLPIRRVLISVTDKSGLKKLIKGLQDHTKQLEIIASEGTAAALSEKNIPFTPLRDYTGFPECFGGRVKTLHPRIAGGILFRKGQDEQEAEQLGIGPIDLVVCNLDDFQKASLRANPSTAQLLESMDIGGSTLIRSACKNYSNVAVIVDPKDYPSFVHELKINSGSVSLETREKLAVKGINACADYEALLAKVLTKRIAKKDTQKPRLTRGKKLPYGENSSQKTWIYQFEEQEGLAKAEILCGKELSYNNYEDAAVAYYAVQELLRLKAACGVAIIKHGSLCAYATGNTLNEAFEMAWEGDSKSAYGSVIAITSPITDELRNGIKNKFVEVLIAPDFSPSFVEWASKNKKRLRMVKIPNHLKSPFSSQNFDGKILAQMSKKILIPENFDSFFTKGENNQGIVTKATPSKELYPLFAFGISAVNYAKSNAVAIVREAKPGCYQLIAMGAGQPNRVDSLERLAIPKAIENLQYEHGFNPEYDPKVDLGKCVIASDGFFPFDDSIRFATSAGIKYCIQPGGSKRDKEVIEAADKEGMCMVMTGARYFSR
ncbi:Bifunctional purine biosynthesis protein purH [Waddlia chondrophila 2032/99]|uniref:Phosphoribosylaminoimidazolecarboxamideformyltra nsferase n=2 Tax=Waddlia chondrophila TaxID=71667 RepID=D6YSF5_WADCW|nr:bifunctional phosphoribosylaminoimidazolecarboxamide formyltransferase/IMP cyclohydrolase [Waddlia chondrophila]ADI39000.1 phosphoribosylaminoimidazolecarboxamideformyltransferase [Waddlia chondrophila WSU 86-1044]CCB92121.1 Bifunctional purine biosynthesis protein purH [Waddlia chondrophila 2032/99]